MIYKLHYIDANLCFFMDEFIICDYSTHKITINLFFTFNMKISRTLQSSIPRRFPILTILCVIHLCKPFKYGTNLHVPFNFPGKSLVSKNKIKLKTATNQLILVLYFCLINHVSTVVL